jgi:hypothetical protein
LLVTANVPSSLILVTLMMQVLISSKTYVLTRVTRPNFPEDAILHTTSGLCCAANSEMPLSSVPYGSTARNLSLQSSASEYTSVKT